MYETEAVRAKLVSYSHPHSWLKLRFISTPGQEALYVGELFLRQYRS